MAMTKVTVRRFPAIERYKASGTVKPFKIKEILRQQKAVYIKKNGEIIKRINLSRKSRCLSGKNRLIFQNNTCYLYHFF